MVSKTADVEGMNCGHCAASVSDALKRLNGVEQAEVSLDQKNVIITLNEMKVTDEMITSAVDEAGYRVKSISQG